MRSARREKPIFRRKIDAGFFCEKSCPPLCRPAGWVCLWRRMGNVSVLNRRAGVAIRA